MDNNRAPETVSVPAEAQSPTASFEPATLPPLPQTKTPSAPQISGYEILAELGRGGMGVVYQAQHTQLDRIVALKMILAGSHAAPADLARFRTEAEAVARLQHPNIVQIHEIGEHDGLPFFSLEYCSGGSLARKLAGTPLPPREAATLVETLARAMEAAHRKGVIHRDLKPANILLQSDLTADSAEKRREQPTPRPSASSAVQGLIAKITDFGLAKKVDDAVKAGEGLTATGAVMGTPSYMAPEQARGASSPSPLGGEGRGEGTRVGPAVDIYALGAILYELLTGRPPFKAPTPLDTILQVIDQEPAPPSRLQPGTPRDLETICLKCLQKSPGQRYATAEELAEDCRRFLAGEPIKARPVSRWERIVKWAKRRPALAAAYGLTLLVTLLGLVGGGVTWLWLEAEAARQEATVAKKQLEDAQEKLDQLAYCDQINLVQRNWEAGNPARARQLLAGCDHRFRGWEWDYLNRLVHPELLTLKGHTRVVTRVVFSADGRRLASASGDKTVKVWDAGSGKELLNLQGHTEEVTQVVFSPDGRRLASASQDKTVKVWDASSGKELLNLQGHTGQVTHVVFSPDGRRLASTSFDKTVKVWDAGSGKELLNLLGHTDWVTHVVFSPDGRRLASASRDKTVKVWDAESGKELLNLLGHTGRVVFSPDGRRLAWPSQDKTVKVRDALSGKELLNLQGHIHWLSHVVFSPDDRRLASASADKTVKVWDAQSGKELLNLQGHTSGVHHVVFSTDGSRLASASQDKTVKVWDAGSSKDLLNLQGHTASVTGVVFSSDGRRLASASHDNTVKVWDAGSGEELLNLRGHTDRVYRVVFSPDGRRLASASEDKTVKVWEAGTGKELLNLQGHTDLVFHVVFSPDGRRLVSASHDKTVKMWDAGSGKELLTLHGHTDLVRQVVFSPDGRRLASASYDGTVKVWDAGSGEELLNLRGHFGWVTTVVFSPDGRRLASASHDNTVKVWDLDSGKELLKLHGHTGQVSHVVFSPDGRRLASASDDQIMKVWNADSGKELLQGHIGSVTHVVFNPDGRRLASVSADQTVKVWDAGSGKELLKLSGHTGQISHIVFSPDGRRLASASHDGTVKVWEKDITEDEKEQRFLVWQSHQAQECETAGDWFAAAFHLGAMLEREPNNQVLQTRRDWAIAKLTKKDPPTQIGDALEETGLLLRSAALQAWFGQDKELADTCARALKFGQDTKDPITADRVAKLCSLRPSDDKTREAALLLARRSVELGKGHQYLAYFQLTLGMAEYRSGHYAAADTALLVASRLGNNNYYLSGTTAFYRAMSLFRQGKEAEAHKLATGAVAKMKPLPADEKNPLVGDVNADDLILWMAYKEAKALLKFEAAP